MPIPMDRLKRGADWSESTRLASYLLYGYLAAFSAGAGLYGLRSRRLRQAMELFTHLNPLLQTEQPLPG
jgi:hypothetical protein